MASLNPPYWVTIPSTLYLHGEKNTHFGNFTPSQNLIWIPGVQRAADTEVLGARERIWGHGKYSFSFVDGCRRREGGIISLIPSHRVSYIQTAGFTYMVSLQRGFASTQEIIKFIQVMLHRQQLLSVILRRHAAR